MNNSTPTSYSFFSCDGRSFVQQSIKRLCVLCAHTSFIGDVWKEVNKKLIGQEAGILAHIDLRLWNLIDAVILESITIKDENLIFFEYYTHSCDWEEEYILFNKSNRKIHDLFKDSTIKIDSIKPNWLLVKVKQQK